jgi:PAS domain S-box-containing protein/putative nucleotidyltransferase with HDIG domain
MIAGNKRETGIHALGSVPWGTHICHFFATKEDLIDVLIPYFKTGLDNNELCIWVTSEPLLAEEAKEALAKLYSNPDDYFSDGQIEIIDASEWYIRTQESDYQKLLRDLFERSELSLDSGFDGLRVAGNCSWLQRKDRDAFVQYEASVDSIISKHKMVAICSYPINKLTASDMIDVVNNHRCCLIRGNGDWQVIESTGRRMLEHKLRQSEERYRILTDNVGDVIWTFYIDSPDRINYISPSVEKLLGYSVEEAMAKEMEEVLSPASYKLAMSTLEEEPTMVKGLSNETTRSRTLQLELYHKHGHLIPVEINYTYIRGLQSQPAEILAVARDISSRKQAENEIRHGTEKLIKAMEDTIKAMAMIVEMRDPYTAGHQRRVTELACAIAEEMGISEDRITGLRLAGLIHDIGKVRIPAEILTNPDGLSDAEFMMIKMHPTIGYEILKTIDLPWPVAQIVYQHHERMNGTGYPLGISKEDIILEARILAVADVVEAIASHRPYRPALGIDVALDEISKRRHTLYDSKVVDACLRLFRDNRFTFN